MKRLILILFVLSACVDQDIKPLPEGANAKTAFGCPNTYRFNISNNSTLTQVLQNVKYNFTIRTSVISFSNGLPLNGVQPITSNNGDITYTMLNTGGSIYRYKVGSTGSWVNVNPGGTSTFTRPTYIRGNPYDCQSNITVFTFTVYTERVNCGTMPPSGNHYNPIVQITSVTNGHTADGSIIGVNTSSQVCPI